MARSQKPQQPARWKGRAKLVRLARRVARIVVALVVVLAMFGGAAAPAAAALVAVSTAPVCHCPHDSSEDGGGDKRSCPCCSGENGGHCLPVGGCASPGTLAPPVLHDAVIPLPLETGLVEIPAHRELDGRLIATGLERPPRV